MSENCTVRQQQTYQQYKHLNHFVKSCVRPSIFAWLKPCFPVIFVWVYYNLSLFLIEICGRSLVYGNVFVRVCNLRSAAGAWSVHLAGVQQAAHRIMMTVASVEWGIWEKNKNSRQRGKKNEENVEGKREGKLTQALNGPTVERGEQEEETNKRGRGETDYVFTLDYFCGIVSVCSSCG